MTRVVRGGPCEVDGCTRLSAMSGVCSLHRWTEEGSAQPRPLGGLFELLAETGGLLLVGDGVVRVVADA